MLKCNLERRQGCQHPGLGSAVSVESGSGGCWLMANRFASRPSSNGSLLVELSGAVCGSVPTLQNTTRQSTRHGLLTEPAGVQKALEAQNKNRFA